MDKEEPGRWRKDERMAFDYEDSLILFAQKYITGLLEAGASKGTVDPVWGSKSLDLHSGEYALIGSRPGLTR